MFGHRANRVGIVVALSFVLTWLAASSSFAQPAAGTSDAHPYFVEFRVATIGAYGHSYAVYGSGSHVKYADLHPMGNYAIMALGHLLPVPANTEWDPEVLKLPVASRYRVSLTAAQYARLVAAVAKAKANKSPTWNAVTNNCNHFIGELAEAIGLKVPGSFQVSYAFVPAMKELNAGGQREAAPVSKRSSKAQAPQT
jgi:hypothetical protein